MMTIATTSALALTQRLVSITGTVNQANSTITRVAGDGSEVVYSYDVSQGLYVAIEGIGAHDTLSYDNSSDTWVWTDGSSQVKETYQSDGSGYRLIAQTDAQGNTTSYSYHANGFIGQITDNSNQTLRVEYDVNNNNVVALHVGEADSNGSIIAGSEVTTVRYTYDGSNRLVQVITDLTPADSDISDNVVYTTIYTYDGASKRVASVTQSDGTTVSFEYDASHRVAKVITGSGADAQVTEYEYDTANNTTEDTSRSGCGLQRQNHLLVNL